MMKILFRFIVLSLLFTIVCGLFLTMIATTETGSKWFINRLIKTNDIPLTIRSIEGRISNKLTLHDLHYSERGVRDIKLGKVVLDLSASALLKFEARVTRIVLTDLEVQLTSDTKSNEALKIRPLKIPIFPLAIHVDEFSLNNTKVFIDESKYDIQHVKSKLSIDNGVLIFQLKELMSVGQYFTGEVHITKNKISIIESVLHWEGIINEQPGHGILRIHGAQNNLMIQLEVNSIADILAIGNLNLIGEPVIGEFTGEIKGKIIESFSESVTLDSPLEFKFRGDTNFINGEINTTAHTKADEKFRFISTIEAALPGRLSDAVSANVNWETVPVQSDNPLLSLKGQGDFILADQVLKIDHELQTPSFAHLTGEVNLLTESVNLAMDWDAVDFSLSDSDLLQLRKGLITAKGKLDAVSLLLETSYLIRSRIKNDSESVLSESVYAKLIAEGEMNLLSTHPTGQLSGSLKMPVPTMLASIFEDIEDISFALNSDQDSVDLSVTSIVRTIKGDYYDLKLKSNLDLSLPDTSKLMYFNWAVISRNEINSNHRGSGQGQIIFKPEQITVKHDSNAPYLSTLQGNIYINATETVLKFDLNWQDLNIPIDNTISLKSERGKINLEGPLSSLIITADGHFQSEPVGSFDLDLNVIRSDSLLTINTLETNVLGGKVIVNGVVNLQGETKGQLRIETNNLNFGKINPDLESQLNVSSALNFSGSEDGFSANLNIASIAGKWREFPVSGLAELTYTKDLMQIDHLHLESGNNTIDLNLNMNQILNGSVDLSIQDLSVFSSELAGKIEGRIDISGSSGTPKIEGKLAGESIYVNNIRMASFTADTQIDLRPQQHSSVLIQVASLRYEDNVFDEVSITGKGLTESHTINVTALSQEFNLHSNLNGGLKNKIWLGKLNQFDLTNNDLGVWHLSNSTKLEWIIKNNAINLEQTCLSQNESYFCIRSSGELNATFIAEMKLNRIPLKFVDSWLMETMSLNGVISGNALFNKVNQQWGLETNLEGIGIQLGFGFEDNTEFLDIETASLKASFNKYNREAEIKLIAPKYFNLSLMGSMKNKDNKILAADLNLKLEEINWLEKIEPGLTGSYGKFQTKITANGTLNRPNIDGEFSLQDGLLSIFPIGLELDQVKGKIKSNDANKGIQLTTILASKEKQLMINGHTRLISEKGYSYEFDLTGEDFPLIRTAQTTVNISPELKLNGTQDLHTIRGIIKVPLLDMMLSSILDSAVSVSPDTVIIQSKQPDAVHITDGNGRSDFITNYFDIDVDVFLNPEIHIHGFGLDTRLSGDINVVKPVGLYQPRGEGQVTIEQGNYSAYGQNLEIEQGRLQFAGPLDNPEIYIRAFRPKLPVKAGIIVTGNARQSKLTLFSEPIQTEADTLSYIITGRPISDASGSEGSLIAQAALSLGTKESSVLTNQIESLFNLDEFSIGAGETLDSASLSASKRLSEKLTFRSSFNPFDRLWSFLLNYKLTDNWSVQTESGVTQGVDLIYSVESNTFRDLYDRFFGFIRFLD